MKNFFYDLQRVLSFNALINFIIGERGVGKSFSCKKHVINRNIKKGEEFVYLRRYKTELKSSVPHFFDDIIEKKIFPNAEFKVKGNNFYIDGKLIDTIVRKVIVGYPPILTGATYVAPTSTDTHKGIVYFDPTNLSKKCTAENSVSTTETKEGCMKWYIYNDDDDTYKLILDHNTTARVAYNSNNVNTSMLEVAEALDKDIANWDSRIKESARLIEFSSVIFSICSTETCLISANFSNVF